MDSPSSINTRQRVRQTECALFLCGALCPVGGAQSTGRGAYCTVRSGVSHHWIYLWPQGTVPQALTLFGGVGFIAQWLRRPKKVDRQFQKCLGPRRHFWNCLSTGPTLKTALCHIRALVGYRINTVHQSAWQNYAWYHLCRRWIATTTLDSQLSINSLLFNQVHLYLVSLTWIYMFFYQTFCVPRVFLWSASQ